MLVILALVEGASINATCRTTGADSLRTWTSIDADSKLIIPYALEDRGAETARAFMQDVASRINNRIQLTTDGHRLYADALEDAFGADSDYAMLVKIYGASSDKSAPQPASDAALASAGTPDPKHISKSFVERSNLLCPWVCSDARGIAHASSKNWRTTVTPLRCTSCTTTFAALTTPFALRPRRKRIWPMMYGL